MRVVIVHDPNNPSRQETIEEIEDGLARIMINEGVARRVDPMTVAPEPGPDVSMSPIIVSRRRRTSEGEGQ